MMHLRRIVQRGGRACECRVRVDGSASQLTIECIFDTELKPCFHWVETLSNRKSTPCPFTNKPLRFLLVPIVVISMVVLSLDRTCLSHSTVSQMFVAIASKFSLMHTERRDIAATLILNARQAFLDIAPVNANQMSNPCDMARAAKQKHATKLLNT